MWWVRGGGGRLARSGVYCWPLGLVLTRAKWVVGRMGGGENEWVVGEHSLLIGAEGSQVRLVG